MRRPREVAKASGIPNSLIETSGAVFGRALRARRCSPSEAVVCSLRTRDQSDRRRLSRGRRFSEFDIDALVTKEFHDLSPSHPHRCQSPHTIGWEAGSGGGRATTSSVVPSGQSTALTRRGFAGGSPVSLAFLTSRTGTAVTNAGGINDTYTAITFKVAGLRIQGETSRALESAVWLSSEVLTCDASHPRNRPDRRFVGNLWLSYTVWFRHRFRTSNWRKFGGAHGRWVQCVAQLQAKVPGPLGKDERRPSCPQAE